jgi:hypothetical protein
VTDEPTGPTGPAGRTIRIEIPIASDDELRALRGALLAARATELSEVQRRAARHSFGYGSDTARETMSDEVTQHRRRHDLLDRLLKALEAALADGP